MILIIKTLDGNAFEVDVNLDDSILELKKKIFAARGLYPENLRLIYISRELENDMKVKNYPVQKESTIHLVYRFPSG